MLLLFLSQGALLTQAQETQGIGIFNKEVPRKADKEFQFIALFYNQAVTSNFYPTNDFLKGQLVGRLFGQNTTVTSDTLTTFYIEQRFLPFFIYTPKLMDGKVILRTSFEIDYTWGDVAYGVGGNFGGGLSADQVNLQTQNVQLEILPAPGWFINFGLQRMFDTPYNPYRTLFDYMTNTGYRLMYFGTDAVGITIRKDNDFSRWKVGYHQFYENNIQQNDDVFMTELMYERDVTKLTKWGASVNYVRDRGNGEGGPSILGQGLKSQLTEYNGVYKFPFGAKKYRADIAWLGTFWNRNADYSTGRLMATGFVNANIGSADTLTGNTWDKSVDIMGVAANAKVGYKHGQTVNDIIWTDVIFASGDANGATDGQYNGVMTGNYWGSPAGIFISSGSYLIFPHGNVVNRFTSLVNDISNMGYGLVGATANAQKDFIPHKLNVKAGAAFAMSNYAPVGGGNIIGTEVNARISYTHKVFMNIELHGAYAVLGSFYDSNLVNSGLTTRPINPWTVFISYKWLMF